MSRFLSGSLSAMTSYTPGEQPRDKKYIKLNTNESPYPPADEVVSAVTGEQIRDLRLYSDPVCTELKARIASVYNVSSENVFVSNGSDEILNFAFMAYAGGGAAYADITYGFYSVYAELYGAKSEIIPLLPDFTQDKAGYEATRCFTVIANPNAPTGIALSRDEIERIVSASADRVVLVDEAYVDFGAESAVELISKYKNLLVVMTFSKSRSLAGARLGFAIADKEIIADLEKIKYSTNPYNVNRLTQLVGVKALENNCYYLENCEKIKKTREFTREKLVELGFEVLPSKANFLFAKSRDIGGEELYLSLKARGILVRHFSADRIKDFNRITIGTDEEMQIFIETVRKILEEKRCERQ